MNQKDQILELLTERREKFLSDYDNSKDNARMNFLMARITELDSIISLIQTNIKDHA